MAQADVLNLVSTLSNGEASAVTAASFYSEIVQQWGDAEMRLTNATMVQLPAPTVAQGELTLPSTVLALYGLVWDDTMLGELSLRDVEVLDPEWRNRTGSPTAYIEEGESVKTLNIYPSPFTASTGPGGVPDPLGADYPPYNVVLFHTETRRDVMYYLELPLALLILE